MIIDPVLFRGKRVDQRASWCRRDILLGLTVVRVHFGVLDIRSQPRLLSTGCNAH
jgi:hypothetical protein